MTAATAEVVKNCGQDHGQVVTEQREQRESIRGLWEELGRQRNRLPVWATVLMTAGGIALSSCLGTFFGLWIQGQNDISKVIETQYEMKGELETLTKTVSLTLGQHHQQEVAGASGSVKP
jgi:hypothetical protein